MPGERRWTSSACHSHQPCHFSIGTGGQRFRKGWQLLTGKTALHLRSCRRRVDGGYCTGPPDTQTPVFLERLGKRP